jgi:hypothetical protein
MWSPLVDENLAQCSAQPTGFGVGHLGEIAAGELDLDEVCGSPSQV